MHIQKVKISNFRNIESLEKELNGANILLIAENAKGKSNFIKAIKGVLTDEFGESPLMKGKKEGYIEVITGPDGKNYTFEAKFKEGSDKVTLTVTGPDGMRSKAKSAIGAISGEVEFDIFDFVEKSKTTKGRKEQVEIVKSFFPEEIKIELRKYENHVQSAYEDRTELNKKIKDKEGAISQMDITGDTVKKYKEPASVDAISAKIEEADKHNQNVQKAKNALSACENAETSFAARLEELQIEIEKVKISQKANDEQMVKVEDWLENPKNAAIPKDALMEELKGVNDHNILHERVKNALKVQEELVTLRSESEDLTVLIETQRQAISDTVKSMEEQMPISGLSFSEECLLYNGMPVDESTMSTSEIMMLGARLQMARNPNVQVLLLEHGESLGQEKFNELVKMCNDNGFQLILEQMVRGEQELRIEFIPEV
jgi:predicted ATP-dependent endonuclease of OLD family